MAFGQVAPDINYWLGRKYAILAQQADAGTVSANATAQNANTNAIVGAASANLDRTRATLMPGESASTIGLQGAQAGLLRNQAQVVIPESNARIGQMEAETGLTRANTTSVDQLNTLFTPRSGSMNSVLGARGYTGPGLSAPSSPSPMFRFSTEPLSETKPRRLPGESPVDYMNRTGWGL